MNESKWPYVAGILDGEGTIAMWHINNKKDHYQHTTFSVVIYGTSLNLMKYLISNFGGKYYTRSKTHLAKKIQYAWHVSGRKNKEVFLLGVLPYMVIKKEQVKIALEYLRISEQAKNPELRSALVARCQQLNRETESSTTNTPNDFGMTIEEVDFPESMIESELTGDSKSDLMVT